MTTFKHSSTAALKTGVLVILATVGFIAMPHAAFATGYYEWTQDYICYDELIQGDWVQQCYYGEPYEVYVEVPPPPPPEEPQPIPFDSEPYMLGAQGERVAEGCRWVISFAKKANGEWDDHWDCTIVSEARANEVIWETYNRDLSLWYDGWIPLDRRPEMIDNGAGLYYDSFFCGIYRVTYIDPTPCTETNACGMVANGFRVNGGSCTVSAPPDSSCPVNGSCSAAHYGCSLGTAGNAAESATAYTWTCQGANNGTTASCSEAKPAVAGSCSATHYGCAVGTSTNNSDGTNAYTWTCAGVNGGASVSCSEAKTALPVAGSCSATHYGCSVGTSTGESESSTAYSWNCQGLNGGAAASCSEAKTASLPNLTASGVSAATSATVNDSVSLAATISNSDAATPSGFTNSFQIEKDSIPASFADIDAIRTVAMGVLGAGASGTANGSYAFGSTGTWYVRACADLNGNGVGTITESNENDNCGSWASITIVEAVDPNCHETNSCPSGNRVSCSDTYSDANGNGVLETGETVTYTASPSGAGGSAYTWDPSESTTNITGGSTLTRTYDAAGTYNMRVWTSGRNAGTCSVTVAGTSCSENPSGELTANAYRVRQGSTVTLSWANIQGVKTSCSIINATGPAITPNTSCAASNGTRVTPAINTQTTFTLRCDDTNVDSVTVDVIPEIIEI